MAETDGETLESLLNQATSPANRDEDWDFIMRFCDQINKELEGPQIAVRLLAHKIQSPQERESLYALTTLEACVKNCGKRLHQEIGKFRFLNEIIKVISPKYLGERTSEKVKNRCIELLYSWSTGLPQEMKISEAYQMLKKQGIVKEDPKYIDKTLEPPPPPRPKNTLFEDEDKSKLLARLLKSKHPEDLQAANRLIKNMVKQDAERMEKASRRMNELETVNNNVKLLSEMLLHYNPDSADSEKDIMKELYDNLEKQRPGLFRLASDTDEKDNEAINEILRANDQVMLVMTQYRQKVEGVPEENLLQSETNSNTNGPGPGSSLLDLGLDSPGGSTNKGAPSSSAADSKTLLENQLALMGLSTPTSPPPQTTVAPSGGGDASDLDMLTDIFASPAPTAQPSANLPSVGLTQSLFSSAPSLGTLPQQQQFAQPTQPSLIPGQMSVIAGVPSMFTGSQSQPMMGMAPLGSSSSSSILGAAASPAPTQPAPPIVDVMGDLDILGQELAKQGIPADMGIVSPAPKIPMNQMTTRQSSNMSSPFQSGVAPLGPSPVFGASAALVEPSLDQSSAVTLKSLAITSGTGVFPVSAQATSSPRHKALAEPSLVHSPGLPKPATAEVLSLSDIFVPLEKIVPGTVPPLTAYDKNNLKIIIHFAKDTPRPDVLVMVVTTMSTNPSPVKSFTFLAAVPKLMKVKLQPPSATDLPAYNPILPPAAITQVMLIANPQKERIRVKYKLTYIIDGKNTTDVGDVDNFPVQ